MRLSTLTASARFGACSAAKIRGADWCDSVTMMPAPCSASWIAADPFSMILQFVRAMSDPYLTFFRRIFPWARIDFVDLSPVFAFLFLHPCVVYGLMYIKESILRSLLTM